MGQEALVARGLLTRAFRPSRAMLLTCQGGPRGLGCAGTRDKPSARPRTAERVREKNPSACPRTTERVRKGLPQIVPLQQLTQLVVAFGHQPVLGHVFRNVALPAKAVKITDHGAMMPGVLKEAGLCSIEVGLRP